MLSTSPTATHGEIHYKFRTKNNTTNWFRSDLGLGSATTVECIAISGIVGTLHCALIPGSGNSNTDHAVIKVTGFDAIPVNATIKINFIMKMAQTY
jgi:hypothetical protein